jgi:hypothetical protein
MTPATRITAEPERLDRHFRRVVQRLQRSVPRHVRGAALRAREGHVRELERYRHMARFPRNLRFPGRRVPHFIDELGTRCAIAHLIERDARDLVQHVASERNYARIHELATVPELGIWLEENGLTLDEAALIQPSYETYPAAACVCGHEGPNRSIVEGKVTPAAELLVTATHGAEGHAGPGEVVPLVPFNWELETGQLVVARLGGRYAYVVAPLENGVLKLAGSYCDGGAGWATAPTDLPLDVYLEAFLAESFEECIAILENQSPAWGPGSTGSGGAPAEPDVTEEAGSTPSCAVPGAADAPALDVGPWMLVAGALVLRRIIGGGAAR